MDAMDAMEYAESIDYTDADLAAWGRLIPLIREDLGQVEVSEGPPSWDISHGPTGLQVSLYEGRWTASVPYWAHGRQAVHILKTLYRVAEIVARETGTQGQDLQLKQPVAKVINSPSAGQRFFDEVAQQLGGLSY